MSTPQLERAWSTSLVTATGEKLGRPVQMFADPESARPVLAGVLLGRVRPRVAIVPYVVTEEADGVATLPYTREQIASSPRPVDPQEITPAERDALRAHYAANNTTSPAAGPAPRTGDVA